jgi:hypothetical protein
MAGDGGRVPDVSEQRRVPLAERGGPGWKIKADATGRPLSYDTRDARRNADARVYAALRAACRSLLSKAPKEEGDA